MNNDYVLVAKSNKDNSYIILKLKDEWYLDKDKAKGKSSSKNSLEVIDLVTTQFSSKEHMVERLVRGGYIPDSDVDIFIACKRKKDGKSYIRFDEVLYGGKKDKRVSALRDVAEESLKGNLKKNRDSLHKIYDYLISAVYMCDDLYHMIVDGKTNIPKAFRSSFKKIPSYDNIPYQLKYDRFFGADSYRELRSAVEALVRFDSFKCTSREDNRYEKNEEFIADRESSRIDIIPRLSVDLEKGQVDGQMSFLEIIDGIEDKKVPTTSVPLIEPKKTTIKRITIADSKLSVDAMKKEVFRVLDTLPGSIFRQRGDKYEFNTSVFQNPILDEELGELSSLLTGNMPRFFTQYAVHKINRDNCQAAGDYSDASELYECMQMDVNAINKRFKSKKCVADTYKWCMLFEACMKRDKSYSEGYGSGEDVSGKGHRK